MAAGGRVLDADRPGLLDPDRTRVAPYAWIPISWVDSLKLAAAQWYSWGLLSFGIYWVNRKLPFGKDALLRRLLCHVPLSLVFTVAYTYVNYGATLPAGRAHRDCPGSGRRCSRP